MANLASSDPDHHHNLNPPPLVAAPPRLPSDCFPHDVLDFCSPFALIKSFFSIASIGRQQAMTQLPVHVPSFSRKRLADGPLSSSHPSKHPRFMGRDVPEKVVAYVARVLASAPEQHLLPVSSRTSASTKILYKPMPDTSAPHHSVSTALTSFTKHILTPGSENSEGEDPNPLVLPPNVRLQNTSTLPNGTSSRPIRLSPEELNLKDVDSSLEASFNGTSPLDSMSVSLPRRENTWKGSKSIVHASQWRPLDGTASSTQSSIASTSQTTLDSAQSSGSVSSAITRSPATSATPTSSVPSYDFGSFTPHPKPSQIAPNSSLQYSQTLSLGPNTTWLHLPPFGLGTPTNSTFSLKSEASLGQAPPKYISNYTSNPGFDDSKLLYHPALTSQQRQPRRGKKRTHIFESQHKASLAYRLKEIMEDVRQQWFETATKQGYGGTRDQFDEYTDYARRTRRAVREDAETQGDEWKWLCAQFDNARKTFNGPKPQSPFFPTLEQLSRTVRAKDAAINDRLRPPRPQLPRSLPPKDAEKVDATLRERGIIAKVAKETIADIDIRRLHPRQWLNDEIINFYGAMIMARAEEQKENIVPRGTVLRVFYLSTFFWTKLTRDGYEKGRLAKWTKKVDIFSRDLILIPVNHGNAHWTAAAINFQKKRFESYDSMGMAKDGVWKQLREYIRAEHLNKKKKPFDFTGWIDWAPDDTPQQDNGYDCGVFTCQFLESLSRGEDNFIFTQEDMPYLRRRMVWEIANTQFRNDV